jgi:hypothetical protein
MSVKDQPTQERGPPIFDGCLLQTGSSKIVDCSDQLAYPRVVMKLSISATKSSSTLMSSAALAPPNGGVASRAIVAMTSWPCSNPLGRIPEQSPTLHLYGYVG